MPAEKLTEALYEELSARKIVYDFEPFSFGHDQRVRLPHQLLPAAGMPKGTCLDLALLFAACLEAGHEHPLLFQLVHPSGTGHALIGLWLRPPPNRRVVYHDTVLFSFRRSANVLLLESTGVTIEKAKGFAQARSAAKKLFNDPNWSLRFALDISRARQVGIVPWGDETRPK